MEKELKNLTPEMVEELRELGIEFEDTQDVWRKQLTDWKGRESREYLKHYGRYINDAIFQIGMESYETLPCPNLQEVLEKLPKQFNDGKNCYCLIFDYAATILYYYNASKIMYPCNSKVSPTFHLDNPLLASFELLKWVATNHPESLTKTTER